MAEGFEAMLTGGHPNSLGRTEEVVDLILADKGRLQDLYHCYFSEDEVVRLRVSSAFKRVTAAQPELTMEFMDRIQSEIANIDQASTQWTLAILFDQTGKLLSLKQHARALEIMKNNLANHKDWIVLNTTMNVLVKWAKNDAELVQFMLPHLKRLSKDGRKSVAGKATRLLAQFTK